MENYLGAALMGIGIAVICYRLGFKNGINKGICMGKIMANMDMLKSIADKFNKDEKTNHSEVKEELNR